MKYKTLKQILVIAVIFVTSYELKASCEVTYDRTACVGKEKEAYSKCDGKKSCIKKERAEDEQECVEAALKACPNSRLQETKSKVITASWKGKALTSPSGKKDFCEDYSKRSSEYDQCK